MNNGEETEERISCTEELSETETTKIEMDMLMESIEFVSIKIEETIMSI